MKLLDSESLLEALTVVGARLAERGHALEVIAIGGSALQLLGFTKRPTKDLDILALVRGGDILSPDPLPEALLAARREVALLFGLAEDWLNAGPRTLMDLGLPVGFMSRTVTRTFGALTLHLAGRLDQIHFKLYAAVDQGPRSKHVLDLRALAPTPDELVAAAHWTTTHDPSPGFREELVRALAALGVPDGDQRL